MTTVDLLEENPDPTEAEVRHALQGNLCRCTGYQNIVDSILEAAKVMRAKKPAAKKSGAKTPATT